jgi:hypothetical protein
VVGAPWWAHVQLTRINIKVSILPIKIEELRILGAFSAINGLN